MVNSSFRKRFETNKFIKKTKKQIKKKKESQKAKPNRISNISCGSLKTV
jgi:hypothetical protein